jgi:hypothetical protein
MQRGACWTVTLSLPIGGSLVGQAGFKIAVRFHALAMRGQHVTHVNSTNTAASIRWRITRSSAAHRSPLGRSGGSRRNVAMNCASSAVRSWILVAAAIDCLTSRRLMVRPVWVLVASTSATLLARRLPGRAIRSIQTVPAAIGTLRFRASVQTRQTPTAQKWV